MEQLQFYLQDNNTRAERKAWERLVDVCLNLNWPKRLRDDILKRWLSRCKIPSNKTLPILEGVLCGFGYELEGIRDDDLRDIGENREIREYRGGKKVVFMSEHFPEKIYRRKEISMEYEIRLTIYNGYRIQDTWKMEELVDLRDAMIGLLCDLTNSFKIEGRIVLMPLLMQVRPFYMEIDEK
jgi:hypothetical protein